MIFFPAALSLSHKYLRPTDFKAGTYFQELIKWFLEAMDEQGVVVVLSAGNGGYNKLTGKPDVYQAERAPVNLVTDDSPYISVGATYHDGSIAEFTTPPGIRPGAPGHNSNADDLSISMWAQGVHVYTCNTKDDPELMGFRSGTSFSAPQVVSILITPPPCASHTNLVHHFIQELANATRLLMVLLYPGRPCRLHAFVSMARGSESFQPGWRWFHWPAHEDDAG